MRISRIHFSMLHFEILWLINKSDYYGALHHEDTRIAQLEERGTCSSEKSFSEMVSQRRWVLTGASGQAGRTALWEHEQLHGARLAARCDRMRFHGTAD